jgi:hypothetical protein
MKMTPGMPNHAIDRDARKRYALPGARHRGRYVPFAGTRQLWQN